MFMFEYVSLHPLVMTILDFLSAAARSNSEIDTGQVTTSQQLLERMTIRIGT